MIKTLQILFFAAIFFLLPVRDVSAKPVVEETESVLQAKTEKYIRYVYQKIKFLNGTKLRYEVFKTAFYGYLNMLEAGKIDKEGLLSVCDFTLSSNKKRMWVIDIKAKKVLFHSLVAHGMGTGEEFATTFSNISESHQSSLGFYTTGETYIGNNGYSLKLNGVDGSFNSNAYDRAIVIHGADYVSEQFAKDNERLGRSHGCPALPVEIAPQVIDKIKFGSCFFIYHRANNYLSSSRWLTSAIHSLPAEADLMDLNGVEVKNNPRYVHLKSEPTDPLADEEALGNDRKEKVYSSIIIVNLNPRTGASDTTIVK